MEKVVHIVKKLYCRLYQLAYRAALPVLPYREPKILASVEKIALELEK